MGKGVLEDIKDKAPITEVVQKFGNATFTSPSYSTEFRGIHGTHSSSSDNHCIVDPIKGFWRCYSCGQGGSVIDWVLSVEFENNRMCLKEAAQRIAKEFEIQFDDIIVDTPQYQAWQTLTRFAFQAHANLKENMDMRAYVRLNWGISDETIDKLCIGYSPDGTLADALHADMANAGLYNGDGHALLRARITFPYFMGAQVRWIAGRYAGQPPDGTPKYQALQSTPFVSPILYNFDNALRAKQEDPLIITEGPADAAAAFNQGLRCVAVNSTSVRPEDVEDLLTLCKASSTLYIIMDSEESKAGYRGAKRTAQIMVTHGFDPYIVVLPQVDQKTDLCEFLKSNTPADLTMIIKGGLSDSQSCARTLADITIAECPERPQGAQFDDIIRTFNMLSDAETDRYIHTLHTKTTTKKATLLKMMKESRKEIQRTREKLELIDDYTEVPFLAQDFEYDPFVDSWKAHVCVYAPYANKKFIDSEEITEVVMVPLHIVTGMPPGGDWSIIDRTPLHKPSVRIEAMIPMESVLNFPASHRYAWSYKSANPHSVTNFIHGKAPTLDLGEMYNAILNLFTDYVVYPDPRDAHILTLFTFFTYIFMGFNVTPYMHCHGPKGSGKSTTLSLLSHLCFNAIASSSMSTAAANRLIHLNRPTLIMDEAERLKNPKPSTPEYEIFAMALAGYTKSATSQAYRCMSADQPKPISFWTYCPKVFGSIGELQRTLASRSIVVQCRSIKKEERDQIKDFSKEEIYLADAFQAIRDQLHIFGLTAFREVRERYDSLDKEKYPMLESRPRQIWLPLLAIAEVIQEKGGLSLTPLVESLIREKLKIAEVEELSNDFQTAALLALYRVLTEDNPPGLLKELRTGQILICTPEACEKIEDRLRSEVNWTDRKHGLATYQVNRLLRDAGCIPAGSHSKAYVVAGKYGDRQQAHYPFDVDQLAYYLEAKGIDLKVTPDGD